MAAGSSSGEESASGTSPEPEQQEQAASSLETMMSRLLQEFGGVREDVRRISVRTEALEGALADVSLSGSGGPPNGSGSMSATPMGAASAERLERAPDQGPSRDGASHAQEDGDDAATASSSRDDDSSESPCSSPTEPEGTYVGGLPSCDGLTMTDPDSFGVSPERA